MNTTAPASLTESVTPISAGAHVLAAAFPANQAMLALADGTVLLVAKNHRLQPHGAKGILVAASDEQGLITGGDDGCVMRVSADGVTDPVATNQGGWIDAIAAGAGGSLAWSTGKKVSVRDGKGQVKNWTAPSTPQGLAFMPKGYRLAISHYNGASLWFPNLNSAPEVLAWKGSHLAITASPDGRFVVTSMQDNMLHGWRLPDAKDMRMSGYPSKTKSFSWSSDGLWLATSGADAAIIWPFKDKDGPMGKAPRECGVRHSKVSQVAFHPKAMILAIGYEDSCILLCRLTDGAELLVRHAVKDEGRISALAWDGTGKRLLFGTEEGAAGLLTLP